MKLILKKGVTSKLLRVFIQNNSVTTGAGLTGLVFNSGSLTAYYIREGDSSATAITLATMTVGTWATGGFKEVDATNMPGLYEIGIPNAVLATGSNSAVVMLKGAANMATVVIEIQLVDVDLQDTVRFGLTALPNAAAEAAGGLYTRGTGAGQINQPANGRVDVNAVAINSVATTSVTTVAANQGTTQPLNFTGTGASALVKGDAIDLAGKAITAAAGVTFPSSVASPTNITAGTITTTTNLTNAPTAGDFTATMKTSLNAATPALSAAGVQAIWDKLTSGLTTVGSIGKLLVDNINATISSRSTFAGGAVASVTADVGITQAAADKVWDTTLSGHLTAGSTGAALNAAGSSGDPWATALPGAYGAGSAGNIVGNNLNATVSSRSTLDGTGVQSAMTSQGYTSTRAGYLDTLNGLVAAIWASVTRTLTAGTNIVLAKGTGVTGFNDLSAAQVNTEVDTGLSDVGLTTTVTGRIDAAISSRLASGSYVAPDNAGITTIQANQTTINNNVLSRAPSATAVSNADLTPTRAAKLDNLDATVSSRSTLTAANVWAFVIEGALTAQGVFRLILASVANKLSGAATTTIRIRDLADTKDRITATVDSDGNRSAVTLDGS